MPDNIITRMGDGARVALSAEQVKEDILAGTLDAADRGKMPDCGVAGYRAELGEYVQIQA